MTDAAGQASGCLIAVVDGVSSSAFGASVARWLADEHLAKDPIADEPAIPLVAAIESYLAALHREFVEEFEDLEPMFKSAASISLAVVRGAEACIFWLGDSPAFLTKRRGDRLETDQVTTPHIVRHRIRCFTGPTEPRFDYLALRLEAGDIITIMSDGAIHEATMLNEYYQREGFSQQLCDEVLALAIPKPASDDTSIVACQVR